MTPTFPMDAQPVLGETPPRGWSYDRRVNVLLAATRRAGHKAATPVSVHPVRPFDLASTAIGVTQLQEVTRFVFGFAFMGHDGTARCGVVVRPHRYRSLQNPQQVMCVGGAFAAHRGEPTGLLRPGRAYFAVSAPTPPWIAAMFDSEREACCGAQ